jgi:hypothetical protein
MVRDESWRVNLGWIDSYQENSLGAMRPWIATVDVVAVPSLRFETGLSVQYGGSGASCPSPGWARPSARPGVC